MNQALTLICNALSHAGEDQQYVDHLSRLEERRITPDKVLPPMEFLFSMFGKPCFPRGELVGLTGKPKSGKTFVSSILMSLCFREEVLTIRRTSHEPLSVLWYDTEQSDESTQDIMRNRIMPMIEASPKASPDPSPNPSKGGEGVDGWGSIVGNGSPPLEGAGEALGEAFNVFNVRQDPWRDRLPMLEVAVSNYHPDMVIVDGIRDLVNDINDGVLAQETIERLMNMASDQHCCIVCILHQNKSSEDKNLRGWIGTELTHKAFEVYECEKGDDRVFSLSQKLTRKYDILDSLKYVVDEHGIPQLATVEEIIKSQRQPNVYKNSSRPELNKAYIMGWDGVYPIFNIPMLFADAIPTEGTLCVSRILQETVMKLSNVTSLNLYNRIREQALSEGIIKKTANEFGHVCYYRPKAEKIQEKQDAITDLFSAPLGDIPF